MKCIKCNNRYRIELLVCPECGHVSKRAKIFRFIYNKRIVCLLVLCSMLATTLSTIYFTGVSSKADNSELAQEEITRIIHEEETTIQAPTEPIIVSELPTISEIKTEAVEVKEEATESLASDSDEEQEVVESEDYEQDADSYYEYQEDYSEPQQDYDYDYEFEHTCNRIENTNTQYSRMDGEKFLFSYGTTSYFYKERPVSDGKMYIFRDVTENPEFDNWNKYVFSVNNLVIHRGHYFGFTSDESSINVVNSGYSTKIIEDIVRGITVNGQSFMDQDYNFRYVVPIFKVSFNSDGTPYMDIDNGQYQSKDFYRQLYNQLFDEEAYQYFLFSYKTSGHQPSREDYNARITEAIRLFESGFDFLTIYLNKYKGTEVDKVMSSTDIQNVTRYTFIVSDASNLNRLLECRDEDIESGYIKELYDNKW